MKKSVSIILALIISASAAALAGCGSKKQAEQPMPAVQSNVTSAQESMRPPLKKRLSKVRPQ